MRMTVAFTALVVGFAMAAQVQPSRASEGPWCSHYFGTDYTENCSMRSFDMCLNEIRGTGGSVLCSPNPHYRGDGALRLPARRVVRNRRHRG